MIENLYAAHTTPWIISGIQILCQRKRDLYLISRVNNDSKMKSCNKSYCKTLSNVIKEANKLYYNKQIVNSNNKMKTTLNIIKSETVKIIKKT
jgi:hypothetical protein